MIQQYCVPFFCLMEAKTEGLEAVIHQDRFIKCLPTAMESLLKIHNFGEVFVALVLAK